MADKTTKSNFDLEITGEGVLPDTTRAGELAELLQNIEKAITETAKSQDVEIVEEAVVSLVGIEEGSNKLTIAIAAVVVPAASMLSQAVASNKYERIPPAAHEAIHQVSNQAIKKKWSVKFKEQRAINMKAATICADSPVPSPPAPPQISGTTSIYGRCIRVGGVKPKAEIRLGQGGFLHIEISEEMAKELARSLYEEVCLEGEATWRTDDWKIERFKATKVTSFRKTDPLEAFVRLAEAANGRWDGVDVNKYLEELRPWRRDE